MDLFNSKADMGVKNTPTGINQLLDSMDTLGQTAPKQPAAPVGGMSQIDSFMGPPPLNGGGGGGSGMDLGSILKLIGPLLGM